MMQMIRPNTPLLDTKMPNMDSFAFLKHIREDDQSFLGIGRASGRK
jgi:CheY-like chemotaxis protein